MEFDRFIDRFDDEKNIKQTNELVEAKYKLSLTEIKIVLAIASQIAKSGQRFERVRVSASALIDFCCFPKSKGYSMLKAACCSLRSKVIYIKLEDGSWYVTGFVNSAHYHDGVIDFTFDKNLKVYMLNVKQAYLSADAKMLCTFKSELAVRLYMLIKNTLNMNRHEYSVKFIREILMLPKSYGNITHFKNKFLNSCIAEINVKSDINVDYELIKSKSGKSYEKVKFKIRMKKSEEKTASSKSFEDLTDEEKAARDSLIACEVLKGRADKLIKEHGAKRCDAFVTLFKAKKMRGENIHAGLLISMIENPDEPIPISTKQQDEEKQIANKKLQEQVRATYEHPKANPNSEFWRFKPGDTNDEKRSVTLRE